MVIEKVDIPVSEYSRIFQPRLIRVLLFSLQYHMKSNSHGYYIYTVWESNVVKHRLKFTTKIYNFANLVVWWNTNFVLRHSYDVCKLKLRCKGFDETSTRCVAFLYWVSIIIGNEMQVILQHCLIEKAGIYIYTRLRRLVYIIAGL